MLTKCLPMIESLQSLIESLREELKNYGAMLNLLDRQWEFLRSRAMPDVSRSIGQVQEQGVVLEEARRTRETCFRAVAQERGNNATSFAELIPALPQVYQPLLKALVEENNELLFHVRRRARQNHLLLQHSVDMMKQVVNSLCPEGADLVHQN